MGKTAWTEEQLAAIDFRGSILVAAAAGSGKTAVLVERIIRRLTGLAETVEVDRLLVVTFTKAAANEMRERIRQALEDALIQETDPLSTEHILHQLAVLPRANITTLHSFCLELLREYFYQLELDPAFRVADAMEGELLRQDTLADLFEGKYDSSDLNFLRLVEAFGSDRDDSALGEQVLRLYEMAYSQPEPEAWLNDLPSAYLWDSSDELAVSPWGMAVRRGVADRAHASLLLLQNALDKARELGGPAHYQAVLEDDLTQTRQLVDTLHKEPWSEVEKCFGNLIFCSLPNKRLKRDDPDGLGIDEAKSEILKKEAQDLRNQAKKGLTKAKEEIFQWSLSEQIPALREMAVLVKSLADLVIEFAKQYRLHKSQRNVVDFTDLEHLALRLLEDEGQTSAIALSLQERFIEVLVDEYQDINPVQERILQRVARSGNSSANIFMVGDVKQSIYRFRLADPTLFLTKYASLPRWRPNEEQMAEGESKTGVVIDLARNFRSRQEVVAGVNFLFRQIMTEGAGEIPYDARAALQFGAKYVSGQEGLATAEGPIELHLFDKAWTRPVVGAKDDDENMDENADEENIPEEIELARAEASLVANRIAEMVGQTDRNNAEFKVYDSGLKGFREVRYSDIVVLMRSYSSIASIYQEEFQRAGIPVYAETSKGYFAANEVENVVSLLKVIDNPHIDIAMAGVLRSPLVGLNGSELGKLRAMLPRGDFYEACVLAVWATLDHSELLFTKELLELDLERAPQHENQSSVTDEASADNRPWPFEILPVAFRVELRQVLAGHRDSWEALLGQAQEIIAGTPSLGHKVKAFWLNLHKWRNFGRRNSLAELIWLIYADTGYFAYVGLLPGGIQRQANLRVLYDRACRFESTHYRGLFRFLRFLEKFRGQGKDMGNARALGENENVVRLQTVHSSKGLEFPVVFVVGLGTSFNTKNLTGTMLLHTKLGIGIPVVDTENRVHYPSFIRAAVKQLLAQESLAEELRILYVAFTRAKERLLLYGGVKDLNKALKRWRNGASLPGLTLSDEHLRNAKCFLDWIGPALARHPAELFGGDGLSVVADLFPEENSQWKIVLHEAGRREDDLRTVQEEVAKPLGKKDCGSELDSLGKNEPGKDERGKDDPEYWYQELTKRLGWVYPHQDQVKRATKTSVSELKRLFSAPDENAAQFHRLAHGSWTRPKFLDQRHQLNAAERGIAFHTVMQQIPFQEWGVSWATSTSILQKSMIKEFLELLGKREILTEEQIRSVPAEQIFSLLNSTLGNRLLNSKTVYRELPFTLTFPVLGTDNPILIQGVMDALIVDSAGSYVELIDYKTDYFGQEIDDPEQALQERYGLQLAIYTLAVERLFHLEVTKCTLYSFMLGREVDLPIGFMTRKIEDLQELNYFGDFI